MAKNFLHDGDRITVAASGAGVSSGDVVIVGAIAGVALADADAGAPVVLKTTGVWRLPKRPTETVAQGSPVSWDADAGQVALPAAGRYPLGAAVEGAGNGSASVTVRLDGVATAAA